MSSACQHINCVNQRILIFSHPLFLIFFLPLINVYLRVFYYVFRQTSHINLLLCLIFIFLGPLIVESHTISNLIRQRGYLMVLSLIFIVFLLRINISQRVFFDVFRQTSHINFLLSLIFILFWPLIDVFLRASFTFFDKPRILICCYP